MLHHYANIIAASRRRMDPDAADYFSRIVAAGSSISDANKTAINAFVVGCKTDGIWTAIKASCILAGADDLTGALVPLVGAAPTSVNFSAGDYSRTTGLKGNASNKYINSNRNNNADPQNNMHHAVYVTVASGAGIACSNIGAGAFSSTGATHSISDRTASDFVGFRNRSSNFQNFPTGTGASIGFIGHSRSSAANYNARVGGTTLLFSQTSETQFNGNVFIFARNSGAANLLSDARISYYSIGESIDLSLLDARLTTLMAALT